MGALIGQILALAMAGGRQARGAPIMRFLPLWVAAGLLAFLAVIFLVLAGFFALSDWLGAPAAAALTGGILFLLAVLLLLLAMALRPATPVVETEPLILAQLMENLGAKFGEKLEGQAPLLAVIAALSGAAFGYSPTLRRWLRRLLQDLAP